MPHGLQPDIPVATEEGVFLDVGDIAEIDFDIYNLDDELTDPLTLSAIVQAHDQTAQTYIYGISAEISRLDEGLYRLSYPVTLAGLHMVRVVASVPTLEEPSYFRVRKTNIV